MDMLRGPQIAEAGLVDWRKLAQGLYARYLVDGFGVGARFVVAVGEAADTVGHHPRVSMGRVSSTSSWSATTRSTARTTAPSTSSSG